MEDASRPDSGRDDSLLLDIPGTKRDLKVGTTKLYELMNGGELEVVKIGNRTLITRRSINALIARKIRPPPPPPPLYTGPPRKRGRPRKHPAAA